MFYPEIDNHAETINRVHELLTRLEIEFKLEYNASREIRFKEFKTWTRWREIIDYVRLAVANRSDHVTKTIEFNRNKDPDDDILVAAPIDMGTEFEECSATNTRNKLIAETMDNYLSDAEWYRRA